MKFICCHCLKELDTQKHEYTTYNNGDKSHLECSNKYYVYKNTKKSNQKSKQK